MGSSHFLVVYFQSDLPCLFNSLLQVWTSLGLCKVTSCNVRSATRTNADMVKAFSVLVISSSFKVSIKGHCHLYKWVEANRKRFLRTFMDSNVGLLGIVEGIHYGKNSWDCVWPIEFVAPSTIPYLRVPSLVPHSSCTFKHHTACLMDVVDAAWIERGLV